MYTFNHDSGKLIWISTTPVSGDHTVIYLVVTQETKENVPVRNQTHRSKHPSKRTWRK